MSTETVEGTSSSFASTSTAEQIPNKTGKQAEEKFATVDLSATSLPPSEKRNPLSHELKQSLEQSIIKVSLRSEDFHKKELILDVHSSLASGKEFLAVRSNKDFEVFLQLLDQEFLSSLVIPTLLPANKISLHNQLGLSSFVKTRESKPLGDVDAARPYQLLLEHIADHSVLRNSDAVWDFLTCTDEQWAKAPSQIIQIESAQKLQSAASKGILFSLKKFATVEKPNPEEEKLIQFAKQIAFTTNYFLEHLKQYCKAQYELQESMDIVGREFKIWGNKYEQDVKEDYEKWHNAGDRIIEMFKKGDEWLIEYKNNLRITVETIVYFYEQANTLQKYIYSRSERQADLNIVGAEYKAKLAELQKLKEKNPNPEAIQTKLKPLEESIATLKHDIDRLLLTLNAIKQHQMQEFLLFRQQFQQAYQKCMTLAVQTQVHHSEGIKSVLSQ